MTSRSRFALSTFQRQLYITVEVIIGYKYCSRSLKLVSNDTGSLEHAEFLSHYSNEAASSVLLGVALVTVDIQLFRYGVPALVKGLQLLLYCFVGRFVHRAC